MDHTRNTTPGHHADLPAPHGPSPSSDERGGLLQPDSAFDADVNGLDDWIYSTLSSMALGEQAARAHRETPERSQLPYTTLALYTADGLLEALEWANAGQPADENACLWLAYLRWSRTQSSDFPAAAPTPLPRWLDRSHAPSGASHLTSPLAPAVPETAGTLAGLSTGAMGEVPRPVQPAAQGADVVVRSLPLGLLPIGWKPVTTMAVNAAAITHGLPQAHVAAVAAALMVQATITTARRDTITSARRDASTPAHKNSSATVRGSNDVVHLRAALEATVEALATTTLPVQETVEALHVIVTAADTLPSPQTAIRASTPQLGEVSEATRTIALGIWWAMTEAHCTSTPIVGATTAEQTVAAALIGALGPAHAQAPAASHGEHPVTRRQAEPRAEAEAQPTATGPVPMQPLVTEMTDRWARELGITAESTA